LYINDLGDKLNKHWTIFGSGTSSGVHSFNLPTSWDEIHLIIGNINEHIFTNIRFIPTNVPNSGNNHIMSGYYFDDANHMYVKVTISTTTISIAEYNLFIGGNSISGYVCQFTYR